MSTARAIVPNLTAAELDELCVNTIRTLSMDAVQQANSGHPGTPMALAPLVYTKELQRKFGFEADHVVDAAKEQVGRK